MKNNFWSEIATFIAAIFAAHARNLRLHFRGWGYIGRGASIADMATWLTLSGRTHKSSFRYSRVWEDYRLVSKALKIKQEDTVLCITR